MQNNKSDYKQKQGVILDLRIHPIYNEDWCYFSRLKPAYILSYWLSRSLMVCSVEFL